MYHLNDLALQLRVVEKAVAQAKRTLIDADSRRHRSLHGCCHDHHGPTAVAEFEAIVKYL